MGLVTGGLNGRRYRIRTPLPEGFRDLFLAQVREHAFVECEDAADTEPRLGWVEIFDPARTAFELNDFLIDRYLALTLRADTKKVQGAYFKIALARRFAAVCEERGLERLSKADKEAISEALEAELLRRAVPSVSTTDVVWDIHTGEVVVFATSENTLELVRVLLYETFGVRIEPERTIDWLTDKLDRQEVLDRLGTCLPGGPTPGDDPLEGHELHLASDFLTWLWLQSESSDGFFRVIDGSGAREAAMARLVDEEGDDEDGWNDVTETLRNADLNLWIDSRLKLRELHDEQPSTTILLGVAPATTPEARQNLHQGRRPVEAKLGLKLGELECSMLVSATPGGVAVSGLKLPTVVDSGKEERLLERATLLDLVHTTLKQLFQQFFLARTSPAWEERVTAWLNDELAAK